MDMWYSYMGFFLYECAKYDLKLCANNYQFRGGTVNPISMHTIMAMFKPR